MIKYLSVFNSKAFALFSILLFSVSTFAAPTDGPVDCSVSKINGGGYTTTISSVTKSGSNYTIVLSVSYDGNTSSKALDHFSIQAADGTFSNISFNVVTGTGITGTVNSGPVLNNDPFSSGFKISDITNVGDKIQAATFTITYTLSNLQNQQADAVVHRDNGNDNFNDEVASFTVADFQSVYNCITGCAIPTLTPASGTYTSEQTVSMSTSTSGASIYYTTNGSTPTSGSTRYTNPITVSANQTVKAIAIATSLTNSSVASETYTIAPILATPTFSPSPGTFTSVQNITINQANTNATIRYTTDGSAPDLTSQIYSGPIQVFSPTTINAISVLSGFTNSLIAVGFYNVMIPVATPILSVVGGTYSTNQYVTIASTTVGASIYYTTDGTDPTVNSSPYTGSIVVDITKTVKAIAVKSSMSNSAISTVNYVIKCASPTLTPGAGTYNTIQNVVISSSTPGVSIRYTTDGSDPSATNGVLYSTPVTINATFYQAIKAIAYKTGATNSDITQGNYVVTLVKVTNPVLSPAPGSYNTYQSVSITCPTAGSEIKYTTDGSQPGPTNGTVYSSQIAVNGNLKIIAYSYKDGMANSDIIYNSYSIQLQPADAPTFSSIAGAYTTPQSVVISSTTSGASIYYTTDGTAPTTSSNLYSLPLTVAANTTLTAMAVKNGMLNSQVSSSSYIIKCATPTITPAAGTYNTIQTVSIGSSTPGSTVRYTLDGSDPSATNGIIYSTPITVNATYNQPIKAIAYKSGITNSDIAQNNYIVTLIKVDNPVVSLPAGSYYTVNNVTITSTTSDASFIYTTDGSTPSLTHGTPYTGPVTVDRSMNLAVYAYKAGMADSYVVYTYYYVQLTSVSQPTFTPAPGTYSGTQNITLASTSGATVYYTTDGSIPSTSSSQFSSPISVSVNTTLNAIAVKSGMANSSVASGSYIINCATPVLTPATGTYATPQSVSMSTATSDATIYYTTDGTAPSASSTLYNGTFSVGINSTIKAIAVKTGMGNSGAASETYTIQVPVEAPVFTPQAGTYNTPQNVTITSSIPNASIRYTIDGSTPSDVAGTVYSTAVSVDNNMTLKAIAYKSGMNNSSVTSGAYVINCATPVLSTTSGNYTSVQTISISNITSGTSIYYTTNGDAPTSLSLPYTGSINVGANMTIKAIAIKAGMGNSGIASETYTILLPAVAPSMNPGAGTYTSSQNVVLSSTTPNAEIYYTLDGSGPTTSSSHYTGAVPVTSNLTLKAIAVSPLTSISTVSSGDYVIHLPVAAPQFSPSGGSFKTTQRVAITSATENVSIYYTTDGTAPTALSNLYSTPVNISATTTLKAIAIKTGMSDSPVTSSDFVMLPSAAAPTFTPAFGTYIGSQNVTISTTSSGAGIRFTTDGTTPSETVGTEYTGPVTIGVNISFKAIAYGANFANSTVSSLVYNIKVATPLLSVPGGNYDLPQSLTITCSTAGAQTYYTTDGTIPSATNGTLYSGVIPIGLNTSVIKVLSIKSGMTDSDPVSATYVVNLAKVVTPTFTPASGTYSGTQMITITSGTEGAAIKYTLDGTVPGATNGTVYSVPVSLAANGTLKAIATKFNMVDSDIASGDYKIKPATITFTPAPDNYTSVQSVVLGSLTTGVTIRYTLDGSVPSRTNGITYSAAIPLSTNLTLKVFAYKTGMEDGDIVSGDYTFQLPVVAAPQFTAAPATFTTPVSVTLSSATANASIRYTTDGTAPSKTNGIVYAGPITVSSTTTLNAIAYMTGYNDSQVISGTYTINLGPTDTDGDGVPDNQDDYPLDPTLAFNNYYPGVGMGSLAFEDNWPSKGDYDMNDMVVDYRFNQITNAQNMVVSLKAKLVLRAMGASFHSGFGIELPVTPSQVSSCIVTLKNGNPVPMGSIVKIDPATGLELNQAKAVVILYDDGFNVLVSKFGGIGVNTTPAISFTIPDTLLMNIVFTQPIDPEVLSSQIFNPFIFTNRIRGDEVHLPDFPPTTLADKTRFGTFDDKSVPSSGKYYKTAANLPWALNIYEGYSYPNEKVSILDAFKHFAEWAGSSGVLFPDWYKDLPGYRNASSIYTQQ